MRLTFSVLWFDDDQDYLNSLDEVDLENIIQNWGFSPKIQYIYDPNEFEKHKPFLDWDLLVIDRNLSNSKVGEEFIKEIRDNNVYTEIIFYSAAEISTLWSAIFSEKLEGVYVSDRNSIYTKIERVGLQSLTKILDVENMRGIVMAEVGSLDSKLDELINKLINISTDEQKNDFFLKFIEKIKEQQEQFNKRVQILEKDFCIENLIKLCDSTKRWRNFKSLIKLHHGKDIYLGSDNYESEVLTPRNNLAHGIATKNDDNWIFIFNGKEYIYNEEEGKRLRKSIINYNKSFEESSLKIDGLTD